MAICDVFEVVRRGETMRAVLWTDGSMELSRGYSVSDGMTVLFCERARLLVHAHNANVARRWARRWMGW